eukprot:1150939-Pelagomonas_calceolata.AAC.1
MLSTYLARSGYRPQHFCSAALVGGYMGGYGDVTLPHRLQKKVVRSTAAYLILNEEKNASSTRPFMSERD